MSEIAILIACLQCSSRPLSPFSQLLNGRISVVLTISMAKMKYQRFYDSSTIPGYYKSEYKIITYLYSCMTPKMTGNGDFGDFRMIQLTSMQKYMTRAGFLGATAYNAIARICYRNSVCPSVCMSVTRVIRAKTVEVRIMQFSPYSSPIPLVFAR